MVNKFITGEVLPMLFEMIIAHNENPEFARYVFSYRLGFLAEDVTYYYYLKSHYTRKGYMRDYMNSVGSQYLSAYYTALLLFDLYLQDKDELLKHINKVMLHENTTLEVLKDLKIYSTGNPEKTVERRLEKIHRLL